MLRPAVASDVEAMRGWRNQPANRAVSLNEHEITAEEHAAWWSRVADDRTRQILVFEFDERPLGIVTFFDLEERGDKAVGSWGFFLDNETATADAIAIKAWLRVMEEACAWAFDELDLDELHGEVLSTNLAVRAMNRRFRFIEGQPRVLEDGREFYPVTLLREDRRDTPKGRP
jgi:RimJ/RimL family protein N-acetyltransferase